MPTCTITITSGNVPFLVDYDTATGSILGARLERYPECENLWNCLAREVKRTLYSALQSRPGASVREARVDIDGTRLCVSYSAERGQRASANDLDGGHPGHPPEIETHQVWVENGPRGADLSRMLSTPVLTRIENQIAEQEALDAA